ncbi:MAG TPA: carboxypeptidase regulatory-like domain-containing protein [Bryobacteraceae bacterium]|nr:carboxypeptidase regulatory-like domain-containing protein [Bryobacteraceae bacterium]
MKLIYLVLAVFLAVSPLAAQTATLRGQVTDESGAVIPSAKVTLTGPAGYVKTTTSANDGSYAFVGIPSGNYTVQATAPDLALAQPAKVTLNTGAQSLNLQLKVATTAQQVTVQDNPGPNVTADPSNNASALVIQGEDLQALSDDPEDLQSDLQALAGPSAGPNGGSIYIDGFSGGELPAKDSIREIRINQNPFSPEYDKLGYGRIEIFTKPGTDKFHGSGFYNFADDIWNSRNPYAARKAPFMLKEYGGNLSGPINKRASFFLDVRRDSVDNGAIINAVTLDPTTLVSNPFTDVFSVPQRRVRVSPRVDYQLTPNNTLSFRYGYSHMDIQDAGIGSFNLISRGYHTQTDHQHLQASETAVIGSHVVNEVRFQYFRSNTDNLANSLTPAIQVLGSFNGGGAQVGHSLDTQANYEFQDYISILHGTHSFRFGVRARGETDDNTSRQNFGGSFTFAGGLAPQLDANNQPVLDASGNPVMVRITSIDRYRRTLLFQGLGLTPANIRALGGGATQFTINAGVPSLSVGQADVGAFFGDDWRIRPNFTLSAGLRFETQTNIYDARDFAPRIGMAWAPGTRGKKQAKTVLRAGFGMFYDRFDLTNTLTASRYNGIVQQQYVVTNPDFFPTIPPIASLSNFQSTQSIQEISARLHAPYLMQSAASIERQLPHHTTVAVTYTNSHGVHMLRSADINAPLPGTFQLGVPGSGVFPLGTPDPVFLMESSGLYNQNQLITNVNSRLNQNISLFGFYTFNHARSSTDGLGTFPANPYNYAGEYGPAAQDIHHRVFIGGSVNTKWNVRLSPFVVVQSGPPFDITSGGDLYGTTIFNGRPGIATDPNKAGVIQTPYGLLDPNPTPDEKLLPRNFGRGPGSVSVNMRLAKTFGFGPAREGSGGSGGPGGGGPGGGGRRGGGGSPYGLGGGFQNIFGAPSTSRRYNLILSVSARNLLNHNNPGPIVGNITSPLFGLANQMAGGFGGGGFSEDANNRRLELQMRFTF